MVLQARAEATRRKIIESAVELFSELGYGETGLADVLQRAGVSKGAFYYHFDSKEAVASAIMEEYDNKVVAAFRAGHNEDSPELKGVIRSTFMAASIVQSDPIARVGNELMQGLGQISNTAARFYVQWTQLVTTAMEKAMADWKLRDGVHAADIAEGMWAWILGCHLLSTAVGDDVFNRLTRAWRLALQLLAPQESVTELIGELDQIAADYRAIVTS